MDLWALILLAAIQGLTEFLPVSSSGHLVLIMAVLEGAGRPIAAPITVNIALHVGTLLATVGYFRKELWQVLSSQWKLLGLVLLGTIPAGVIGLFLRKFAEETLESPWTATMGLFITGGLLLIGQRLGNRNRTCTELRWFEAVAVGCFQAVAILPGISRSGATIVGGLVCGLAPVEATLFSFLLAVPVMAGAGVLEATELLGNPSPPVHVGQLLLGGGVAAVVGWLGIGWLIRWVRTGRLVFFAYWVFLVAAVAVAWLILES